MTKALRLAALGGAALAGLAFAGSALASYTPKLAISHKAGATSGVRPTTIHVTIPQSDDPTAVVQIYAPAGYGIPSVAAPGTTIGQATASVFARDTGLTLPLEGPVVADDPAKHTTDTCAPGTHFAVWVLTLSVAGQTVPVPVYVDPTTGTESALGAFKIKVCFGPPDVPAGTPGRAPLGVQALDANFTVDSVFSLPSGSDTLAWRALFTPYVPGKGVPNVAGTVEARSFVGLPGAISIRASYVKKKNAYRISGTVAEGGTGVAGAKVQIFRGRTRAVVRVSSTTTAANGSYATAGHLKPKKTTYFQTRTTVAERDDAAGCTVSLPSAGPPCVSATRGGFSAVSAIIRIKL